MDKYIFVTSTVPDEEAGQKITQAVLSKRLAACVTITPKSQSCFWWKGKITQEQENLLLIKTENRLYPQLEKLILQLHPYEVPEIMAFPAVRGYSQYLAWISGETSSSAEGKAA